MTIVTSVMTDHPAWRTGDDGSAFRVVRSGSTVRVLTAAAVETGLELSTHGGSPSGRQPVVLDVIDPGTLAGSDRVATQLRWAGTVGRWRNPDLWDALATAIVRQVIRAGQARKLYRSFCQSHGDHVLTPHGKAALFPTPEAVLDLDDSEYKRLGLAFKQRPLRAAAEAVLEFGEQWAQLSAVDLRQEVQNVPRIGPWTAGAAVADLTNDYALYPYADLAVRTWAAKLAPERAWPDTEAEFAREWTRLAHDQLSDRTLLTLAWGVRHANATGGAAL